MPKLNLQRFPIGVLDWDLEPNPVEELLDAHEPLSDLHRYCLELKQSPSMYWEITDRRTPMKMWEDGAYVRGRGSAFEKDWCSLPGYIMFEILRAFHAKVLIAQVQADHDIEDPGEYYFFEGRPKYVDVKLVIYTDYEIDSPTGFLANFFRKWWLPKGSLSDVCSLSELRSYLVSSPEHGEEDVSWGYYRRVEQLTAGHKDEEDD